MNMCSHPIRCSCTHNTQLVVCSGALSITDAERGRSVAAICEAGATPTQSKTNLCGRSLRLYSNFRDLIELLHHEIDPIDEGQFHTAEQIDKICGLLRAVRLSEQEYKRYVRFRAKAYTRNLVGYDVPAPCDKSGMHRAKFTVLILCWDKGQMSPIHDHAGSSCWVKVLQGRVREVRYEDSNHPLRVKSDVTLGAQEVCYINDSRGLHAMGNPDPDQVAVSMHVYAPPYILCSLFDPVTGARRTGSMAAARIPSNPFAFVPLQQLDDGSPGAEQRPLVLGEFYKRVGESLRAKQFTEIGSLVSRLAFQENEWKEFVHFDPFRYTRSLVSLDKDYSLMVCCWNNGHATPIHSHGPTVRSWVKVLSGRMHMKKFSGTARNASLVSRREFEEGDLIDFNEFCGLHLLGNASEDNPAVTLHLYSPPFVHMAYLDSSGKDQVIPVVHSATSAGRCCAVDPITECDQAIQRSRCESIDETKSEKSEPEATLAQSDLSDLLSFFQQEQDRHIFTNLNALIRFISARNLTQHPNAQQVVMSLERMSINPEEWCEFLNDDPECDMVCLLARGKSFRLELRRWDAAATTSVDEATWFKVLDGRLVLTQRMDGEQVSSTTVSRHSGCFVSGKLACDVANVSDTVPAFALCLIRESAM